MPIDLSTERHSGGAFHQHKSLLNSPLRAVRNIHTPKTLQKEIKPERKKKEEGKKERKKEKEETNKQTNEE